MKMPNTQHHRDLCALTGWSQAFWEQKPVTNCPPTCRSFHKEPQALLLHSTRVRKKHCQSAAPESIRPLQSAPEGALGWRAPRVSSHLAKVTEG